MNYLDLPYGVRIAGSDPIDADRYLADTISARDNLIINGRAKIGQQCYVIYNKTLYILNGTTNADWEPVGSGTANDANYVHEQNSVASTWIINHNLNKYPSVGVFDSSNSKIEGDIKFLNLNSIQITFSAAFKGTAILN
jgi:hypothetical protein